MVAPPLSVNKIRWYFTVAWLAWSLLVAITLSGWYHIDNMAAIADSIISNGLLLIAVFIISTILTYYHPSSGKILFALLLAIILSCLAVQADIKLVAYFYSPALQNWLQNTLPLRYGIALLVNIAAAAFGLLWYELEEQKTISQRKEETEKIAREAELFKLRQQLQPHFLFNTLNSINALIRTQPEETRKMVEQLSSFLRYTLRREDSEFIALEEELKYLQLYLQIEEVRFGYRLKTKMDIAEETRGKKIPPLLLQPLMENAIKFGLYGTTGETEIILQAKMINNYLMIAIINPFDPDMQMQEGTGFGLKSVRRRLYLLFGRNDLITTEQTQNKFIVSFKIPYPNA